MDNNFLIKDVSNNRKSEQTKKPVMVLASVNWSKVQRWNQISSFADWWRTTSFAAVLATGAFSFWNPKLLPPGFVGATLLNAAIALVTAEVSDAVAQKATQALDEQDQEPEERQVEFNEEPDESILEEHAIAYAASRFLDAESTREKDEWLCMLRWTTGGAFLSDDSQLMAALTHGDRIHVILQLIKVGVFKADKAREVINWANSLKGSDNIRSDIPWRHLGLLRDALLGSTNGSARQTYFHQIAMLVGLHLENDVPSLSSSDMIKVIKWLEEEGFLFDDEAQELTDWAVSINHSA